MAQKKELNKKEIIEKIMSKKEFFRLPKKDVEKVYEFFNKKDLLVEEKIKFTRDLLRKMYTAFVSQKLLNLKDKSPEWVLKKHISTNERIEYYEKLYDRILKERKINVFDFGSGINGFSYPSFLKLKRDINYIGIEPVGQLVDLQNQYFKKENFKNAKCFQESLFDLEKIKGIVKKNKGKKIAFFFKVLDSLEMFEKDYSKKMLEEIVPFFDRVVVSWATRSLVSKKRFKAEKKWLKNFIEENFSVIDEFELGSEKYLVFSKKDL